MYGDSIPTPMQEADWLGNVSTIAKADGLNVKIIILFFVNLSGATVNGVPDQTTLLTNWMAKLEANAGSNGNIYGAEYEREYYGNTAAEWTTFCNIVTGDGFACVNDGGEGHIVYPNYPMLDYSMYPSGDHYSEPIITSESNSLYIGVGYGETGSNGTVVWTQTTVQAIVDNSYGNPYVFMYADEGGSGQPQAFMWNWATLDGWVWNDANYQANYILSTTKTNSTTSISCNPSSTEVDNPIACFVTVAGSSPLGKVTWSASGSGVWAPYSHCTLSITPNLSQSIYPSSDCALVYDPIATGTQNITASYEGDFNNASSNGTFSLSVSPATIVIQPVDLYMSYSSASVPVLKITGCSPSPSTISAPGITEVSMVSGCTFVISNPAVGPNSKYVFGGDGSSSVATVGTTACSSGTCATFAVTDYLEYKDTLSYSVIHGNTLTNGPRAIGREAGTVYDPCLTLTATAYWFDVDLGASIIFSTVHGGIYEEWEPLPDSIAGTLSVAVVVKMLPRPLCGLSVYAVCRF
jgi:hypothetical protein